MLWVYVTFPHHCVQTYRGGTEKFHLQSTAAGSACTQKQTRLAFYPLGLLELQTLGLKA